MQVADSDNISKRMRYYQGLIDGDKLKHGQHYSALGESYIIFICPLDKFKRRCHIYPFKERFDNGIISGEFIQTLSNAVNIVKSNGKARLEFMTLEMYMKERKMEGAEKERIQMIKNLINVKTPIK